VRYRLTVLHVLLVPVAIGALMVVTGCSNPAARSVAEDRHMQPLSEGIMAQLKSKRMEKQSPILMRIFKEESELEVWKQDETGRFALLRTYPICRWSGELGPKIKAGDRQAPEGLYNITPGLMNPNSSRYLAINTVPSWRQRTHSVAARTALIRLAVASTQRPEYG
jgi:murein L,D-transpeptidase YafK